MTAGKQASADRGESEKRGTLWRRIVRVVLVSVCGLVVLYFLTGTGLLQIALSYLWPAVYYTEVTAKVTAEGQRFQLKSVAECRVYYKARWGGLVAGSNPKVIRDDLMAKRLPSGAGLIIVGSALCSNSRLYGVIEAEEFNSPYDTRNINLQKYLDFGRAGSPNPKLF